MAIVCMQSSLCIDKLGASLSDEGIPHHLRKLPIDVHNNSENHIRRYTLIIQHNYIGKYHGPTSESKIPCRFPG